MIIFSKKEAVTTNSSLTVTWHDDWWTTYAVYGGDGDYWFNNVCNECNEYYTFVDYWINDYRDVTILIPGHRYLIEVTLDPKYASVICSGGTHWYSDDCDGDECSVEIEEIWAEISNGDNVHFFIYTYPDAYIHGEGYCRDRDESISFASNSFSGIVTGAGIHLKARVGFRIMGFADADIADIDGEGIVGEIGLNKLEVKVIDLGPG